MDRDNDSTNSERKFHTMSLSALALDHIDQKYRPLRHASEMLARTVNATPNAAKNWLRKQCAPHADHIGAMMENDLEFRAKVAAWIATLP